MRLQKSGTFFYKNVKDVDFSQASTDVNSDVFPPPAEGPGMLETHIFVQNMICTTTGKKKLSAKHMGRIFGRHE